MQTDESKAEDDFKTDVSSLPDNEELIVTTPEEVEPVFGIRIGHFGFLVSTSKYCEVLDKMQVNALPNVHPWISGIVNLRGNLIPVFDLRIVLKEGGNNKNRRLFAIDRGEKAIALWIDSFPEIKNKTAMNLLNQIPELPKAIQHYVTHAYELNNQIWLDIKLEDLFKVLGGHQYATEAMTE